MDEEIRKKVREMVELALKSDGCLITISRREGGQLYHNQYHNFEFYYKDLMPALDEVAKLVMAEYANLLPSKEVNG